MLFGVINVRLCHIHVKELLSNFNSNNVVLFVYKQFAEPLCVSLF